ncbi:glycosyltransferase [Candidatus Altiarchaeota archaeon]
MIELSVILPAYEEGESIRGVIEEVNREVSSEKEILVVVDSLDDSTCTRVKGLQGVHIILNEVGGFARAVETGLMHAKGEYAVVIMADGSDQLSSLNEMLDRMRDKDEGFSGVDVVAPTRYGSGGKLIGAPWLKALFSRSVNRLAQFKGVPISDSTNGFKMYRTSKICDLLTRSPIKTRKFAVSLEIVVKAWRNGFQFWELPTVWTERTSGTSKFSFIKLGREYIELLLS